MNQNPFDSQRIVNFAALMLPDEEERTRWADRMHHARFYTETVGNAVVIFNILREDIMELAKRHAQLPFLFGQNGETGVAVTHWEWGLHIKDNGRLRNGYIMKSSSLLYGDAPLFSEFGLTEALLHEAAACMLAKTEQSRNKKTYSEDDILRFIQKSLDPLYCAKDRYYARATLYHA